MRRIERFRIGRRRHRNRRCRGHHRRGKNRFGVVVGARRIPRLHDATPITLMVNLFRAHNFVPGPVRRRTQINPGNQPVPSLIAQGNAVMALTQFLNQSCCVRVKLIGRQQMQVALHRGRAHVTTQRQIGRRESGPVSIGRVAGLGMDGRQVPKIGRDRVGTVIVTGEAIGVQHRLDLANEGKAPGRTAPWLDIRRDASRRQTAGDSRRNALRLVTSHTGKGLAGHGRHPAAHQLNRLALGVKGLHGYRRICWYAK